MQKQTKKGCECMIGRDEISNKMENVVLIKVGIGEMKESSEHACCALGNSKS